MTPTDVRIVTGIQESPYATCELNVPQTMAHDLPSISSCVSLNN